MNITQENSSPNHTQAFSKYLFGPLALLPAICLAASCLYLTFPVSFYSIFPGLFVVLILLKAVIVPVLAIVAVNLAVPCATNRVKSFLFALPTFVVHLYFFSFPIFWLAYMNTVDPGDTPGAYTGFLVLGAFSIPLEILFLGLATFCAWLGARLRKPWKH